MGIEGRHATGLDKAQRAAGTNRAGRPPTGRMICMARTLGAPVTEPQGKAHANTRPAPARAAHRRDGGRHLPHRGQRACSSKGGAARCQLRDAGEVVPSRSTIIGFSRARFSLVQALLGSFVPSAVGPQTVPFIGCAASSHERRRTRDGSPVKEQLGRHSPRPPRAGTG